jgi:hypothetical protein
MTRHEGLQRLQKISNNGLRILQHLEVLPSTAANETALRLLAAALKTELQEEYERTLPESSQKGMTLFELTVYSPTIEEAWKQTGISRLKLDGAISDRWRETFEAVIYKMSKYVSRGNLAERTSG